MKTSALPMTAVWVDPVGAGFAAVCALHCLVAPFLVTTLPLVGVGFLVEERTEAVLLFASITLAAGSLLWGFRLHRQQRILLMLGAAALMMVLGRVFLAERYESLLVATGAALLAAGHLLNRQLCRACALCEHMESLTDKKAILVATDLCLGYGDHTVLQDVNLEVRAGEFWVFLGQNGSGKTTLLRAFLGLIAPRSGHIWLHPQRAHREHIGFVPQRCDLNPTLPTTVQEFVLLGLVGLRLSRREESERLSSALDKMGLAERAESNYWSLSGGQRQRALVARALVRRPTLLILDEPTNNLDLATEDALLQLLGTLNKDEQQTLLFVTHDIAVAARYATHIGLLHAGTVLAGPRRTVLTKSNLEPIYGARAAIPDTLATSAPGQILTGRGVT